MNTGQLVGQRKCPKCKLEIENDAARFCKKCGTKLPEVQPKRVEQPVEEVRTATVVVEEPSVVSTVEQEVEQGVEQDTGIEINTTKEENVATTPADGILLGDNDMESETPSEVVMPTNIVTPNNGASSELERAIKKVNSVKGMRHGFISFILWAGIIISGLIFIATLILLSDNSLDEFDTEALVAQLISNGVIIVSFILLLRGSRIGFYLLSGIYGLYLLLLIMFSTMAPEIADIIILLGIPPMAGLGILYAILQLKKNGVSYWELIGKKA